MVLRSSGQQNGTLRLVKRNLMLTRNGEDVRPEGRTPFQFHSLGATHTRPLWIPALGFVYNHLRGGLTHLKLRADFLDLRGLLFYHCR